MLKTDWLSGCSIRTQLPALVNARRQSARAPAPAAGALKVLFDLIPSPFVAGVAETSAEPREWEDFQSRLEQVRLLIREAPRCERFRKWADDVARFSFYSGRVLLGPRSAVQQPSSLSAAAGRGKGVQEPQ